MSVSLSFDGFNPGFISSLARNPGFQRLRRRSFFTQNQVDGQFAPVICTACPLRWRSAASDPDLILRALRIRILSSCVGGFSCPKTEAQATTNVLSVTFTAQGLRARQKRSKVLFVACAMRRKHSWRIRLAAYGARLERVLG